MKTLVVCGGQIVADVMVRPFEGLPVPGTSKLVEHTGLFSGGCASNTALTLARLGVPVEVVSTVGATSLVTSSSATWYAQASARRMCSATQDDTPPLVLSW